MALKEIKKWGEEKPGFFLAAGVGKASWLYSSLSVAPLYLMFFTCFRNVIFSAVFENRKKMTEAMLPTPTPLNHVPPLCAPLTGLFGCQRAGCVFFVWPDLAITLLHTCWCSSPLKHPPILPQLGLSPLHLHHHHHHKAAQQWSETNYNFNFSNATLQFPITEISRYFCYHHF